MIDIQLLTETLDAGDCRRWVAHSESGAIVEFIGNVRRETNGRQVVRLEFEAYAPMAIQEMRRIAEQALVQYKALRISIRHRVGILGVGETAVIIAVAAEHRSAAFGACQFCIDALKQSVPIWKKEIFEDGEVWVAAHP